MIGINKNTSAYEPISPYARRHPHVLRWITFVLLGTIMLLPMLEVALLTGGKNNSDNRLNSRVFSLGPSLHNSKPKTVNLNLSRYKLYLSRPADTRGTGESNYRAVKESVQDFHKRPLMQEIERKMESDMHHFGAVPSYERSSKDDCLKIHSTVEIFYPDVRGHLWMKSVATVRMSFIATLNDSTIIDKKYESTYTSSGLDKEFEGSVITTIEQGANVTAGIALRKVLDQFYADLATALPPEPNALKNILFPVASATLPDESPELLAAVDFMQKNVEARIEVDGYSDNQGDLKKDQRLSRDRAKAVKSYLVHHGIKSRRIKTKAFGATRLVSTGDSEEAHALNRRVEFVVLKK